MAGHPELSEPLDRREAVLAATQDALAATGVPGLRLAEVAAAAGVSVGAIQHHFADKDELIAEAFDRHEDRTIEAIRAAGAAGGTGDAWTDLQRMLTTYRGFEDTSVRSRLWIALAGAALVDERCAALIRRVETVWEDTLGEAVRRGVAAGTFRPRLPPAEIIRTLVRLTDGYALVQVADPASGEWSDPTTVSSQFISLAEALLDPVPPTTV